MRALSSDALSAIEAKLDAAWALVIEIWNEVDRTKAEGLRSRLAIARERKRLERAGAFENIETTTRAFRAWQQEKEEADRAARKGKLQKKNSRAKARGVVAGQPAVIENV